MSVGGVGQRLRSGAWCRHRPRLALAHARLAGVTAGVDDRDVNPAGLDLAPFARACAGGEMGCRDKPGNDSGRRAQTLSRPLHSSRSEEHTSELQSLMRISYAVFRLNKTKKHTL